MMPFTLSILHSPKIYLTKRAGSVCTPLNKMFIKVGTSEPEWPFCAFADGPYVLIKDRGVHRQQLQLLRNTSSPSKQRYSENRRDPSTAERLLLLFPADRHFIVGIYTRYTSSSTYHSHGEAPQSISSALPLGRQTATNGQHAQQRAMRLVRTPQRLPHAPSTMCVSAPQFPHHKRSSR